MSKLSKEKLNEIKRSKNYTSKEIALKTGIPRSTIEKIFGGFSQNPTLDVLQKIAAVLDCGLDDFIEYDIEPDSPFYKDRIVNTLMQSVYEKKELRKLVTVSKELDCEDIRLLVGIAERLCKRNRKQ